MKEKKRKVGRPKLPKREIKNVVAVRLNSEELKRLEMMAKMTKETVSNSIRNSSAAPDSRAAQAAEFPDASLYVRDEGTAWSGLVVMKGPWQMIEIKAPDERQAKIEALKLANHSNEAVTWRPVAFRRNW